MVPARYIFFFVLSFDRIKKKEKKMLDDKNKNKLYLRRLYKWLRDLLHIMLLNYRSLWGKDTWDIPEKKILTKLLTLAL